MDQFLTTHRKDFLWPFIRCAPLRPGCQGLRYSTVPAPEQVAERGLSLEEYQRILEARRQCREDAEADLEVNGERTAPAPPLKYSPGGPVGLIALPELQVARNDRTAQSLKALKEKHPYLFNVIRSCPPDDLVSRVFKDRYRSIYQVDYCKQGEYPNSEYDALVSGAGLAGAAPGALPFCPCRAHKYSSSPGKMAIVRMDHNKQLEVCQRTTPLPDVADVDVCLCGLQLRNPAYGRKYSISTMPKSYTTRNAANAQPYDGKHHTEYRDSYNKLGNMIMAEKIHGPAEERRRGAV